MKSGRIWISILVLVSVRFIFAGDGLLCGIAKLDITPVDPVTMAGYANRTELSKGIHDSLSVRVLAFENGKNKLVLVSTDVIGFYSGTAKVFRESILKKYVYLVSFLLMNI